jgi:hypothetical protein
MPALAVAAVSPITALKNLGSPSHTSVRSDLPNGTLKDLNWLTTLNEVPIVDNYGRDSVDSLLEIVTLACANFLRVQIGSKNLPGAPCIQTYFGCNGDEHIVIAGIFARGEIRREQRML